MKDVCVLARAGDLFSLMLIKELQELSIDFDVFWLVVPPKKKKIRHERFIGMNIWSFTFWKDYLGQIRFGHSKALKEIVKDYYPMLLQERQLNDKTIFEKLDDCKDYLCTHNYKFVLVGGVPILPQSFFENNEMMFIGCHPAPLPKVRGEDHLVFTLFYGLYPSVSIYQLDHHIDGGGIFEVVPLDNITIDDNFYSIQLKLEVHRAKALAKFAKRLLSDELQLTLIPNKGRLHQYKDVTNQIRKKAEENLKKLFSCKFA
jgi:methionyl-tRNA formyltransferase